ncbi:MAG TPA: GAF domain-containing sensor histidine kinase [Candidatus Saccharimonadales bacterium]|nr:GAF domain-containing sensor histidine kinase [Candidatus Saccharimonadales bacterium]
MLPIQESAQELILEATNALQPHFAEMTAAWRQRMFEEFQFEGRAMVALERLNLGVGFMLFSHSDFNQFTDNLYHYGQRLAKLRVDTREVARSLEIYLQVAAPFISEAFGDRKYQVTAALETLVSASFVAVSGSYFDVQQSASDALLKVLDAELSAKNLTVLLERVLVITEGIFGANIGVVLLADPETNKLRVRSATGMPPNFGDDISIAAGQGFTGHIFETGEPDILQDLTRSSGVLNPELRNKARALWGAPLKISDSVIGVLIIGFEKSYQWLPTELELFRAVADRSALAIDRARMTDALREREMRIVELSGHLLKAQEEERKRISRELHDETGQALMVIRLYLGMLDGTVKSREGKAKIGELLAVVDRTIEGIRRIIGRLSPLVLQELGLISAIRKEAKDLAKTAGVQSRVAIGDDVGRLDPVIETAIYRVVQESLHNVAKHAQAQNVNIQMERNGETLRLVIEDDGVGIRTVSNANTMRPSFGMAGMHERISTLGGQMRVSSRKGEGTKITVSVPVPLHPEETVKGNAKEGRVLTGTRS